MTKENKTSNFEVALCYTACPICCEKVDDTIIINSVLTKENAEEVKNAHGKCIGFDKNACKKCEEYKDKGIFIVEINEKKERTGRYCCIKHGAKILECIDKKFFINTDNGVKYCLMMNDAYTQMFCNVKE